MEQLFVVGLGCFLLYMLLFHPEKVERANKIGWENTEKTGKLVKGAARFGFGVAKLFRR